MSSIVQGSHRHTLEHSTYKKLTNTEIAQRVAVETGFIPDSYDYISVTYPTATTEEYVFKSGGSGGTTVATVTLTYTDASKENLSTAEKV